MPALLAACALAGCGGRGAALPAVVGAAKTTLGQAATSTASFPRSRLFGPVSRAVVARGLFDFPRGLGYEAIRLDMLKRQPPRTDYLDFLPGRLYLRPQLDRGSVLPPGKNWVSIALTGSASGAGAGFAGQAEALSPQLPLDLIARGAVAATPGKERVIDHVPYTEYVVSVSPARALSRASGTSAGAISAALADELAALRSSRGSRRPPTFPIRVWVDGTGHIARLQAALPGSGLGPGTTLLSVFGKQVPTALPPAGEVIDLASWKGAARSVWALGNR